MKVYASMDALIGNTPILRLEKTEKKYHTKAKLFAKLEYFNPTGSVKDRAAKYMLDEAEKAGLIQAGSVIIEPTSGNTGIGLAAVGAARGYRVIIVMPDTMSIERRKLMKAYGAELVLTDGKLGMQGAIEKAYALQAEIPNAFIPNQFENVANCKAHREGTGVEIYEAMDGAVDIFVAGVGTGGTLTGTAEYLKGQNPAIQAVAVEPKGSPILSGGESGKHRLQGIGAGFIPKILGKVYDEVIAVADEDAYDFAREVGKTEGVFVGISSGAALCAAVELAKRAENEGKNIVVLFPDDGGRYLSTKNFIED